MSERVVLRSAMAAGVMSYEAVVAEIKRLEAEAPESEELERLYLVAFLMRERQLAAAQAASEARAVL